MLLLACLPLTAANAELMHKSTNIGGTVVEYDVVLPAGYTPAKEYPAILAFGGGPQDAAIDQRIIESNFRSLAEQRGYIVVMPAAPGGELFFQGGQRVIPGFLKQMLSDYRIQGGKFRVAGPSNGGISAFEVAAKYPQYFTSITAFPGFLEFPTPENIAAISKLCIHMFVGQDDELNFLPPMQQLAAELRRRHLAVTYRVEPGQGHRIESLAGAGAAQMFDQFDQDRHGCVKER
jgi:poly(3-hydroxybutyrate) depolymerase